MFLSLGNIGPRSLQQNSKVSNFEQNKAQFERERESSVEKSFSLIVIQLNNIFFKKKIKRKMVTSSDQDKANRKGEGQRAGCLALTSLKSEHKTFPVR